MGRGPGADRFAEGAQRAAGLALVMAGPRALAAFGRARRRSAATTPTGPTGCRSWRPTRGASRAISARPAVNLVSALNVSLGQILAEGMEARFARHASWAGRARRHRGAGAGPGAAAAGKSRAHTMTAPATPPAWPGQTC